MSDSLPDQIRQDFPILSTSMNGKPLIYLDNAATTQKPRSMVDAIVEFYLCDNANVHRGIYELSQRSTEKYEAARRTVAEFLGGVDPAECLFTRGTTESINLVANAWGRQELRADDEILLTGMEHHSNIVPWQMICQVTGARLRVVQPNSAGEIEIEQFKASLTARTRLVAIQSVSNALGTIHDTEEMIRAARKVGAKILIDGAQAVAHMPTDLPAIDCDFFAFSGHKLYGPTGIGVLWGRRELLDSMPPFMGGGDMIETVTFEHTTYAEIPNKFEAGTPNISGAIGLAAAIDYVNSVGFHRIAEHEEALLHRATDRLDRIPGVRIVGRASKKAAIVSFVVDQPLLAPLDIATQLGFEGIAVRSGHHCGMPLMKHLGVGGTCRASMAMYNTLAEVDRFAETLEQLVASRQLQSAANREKPMRSQWSAADSKSPNGSLKANPSTTGSRPDIAEDSELANLLFVKASGASPNQVAEELAEDFLFCEDPQSKTKLLLEYGQELPDTFGQLRTISTSVPGCMSEVYLIGRPARHDPGSLELAGDSNAQIVRGLIAVLLRILSGQDAKNVLEFDSDAFFTRIGLDQFITTQRRTGLAGMLRRIRSLAESIVQQQAVRT